MAAFTPAFAMTVSTVRPGPSGARGLRSLFTAPDINPINHKARTLPFFNPVNVYGRVFFFSWFSFFIAFWSWYAFPPLLSDVIAADLRLSKIEVANSNVIGTTATLVIRLMSGPLCDRYGARMVFAITLLVGAVPTFCAGGVTNAAGLYALRFFIGILGGTFVPCQVWLTAFFDKNIVGTANGFAGGFGNAGGGITYFLMPAIYNSLRNDGLSRHNAWRVAFVIPGVLIVACALGLLFLCPDTPTGPWADRFNAIDENLHSHHLPAVGEVLDESAGPRNDPSDVTPSDLEQTENKLSAEVHRSDFTDKEAHLSTAEMLNTAIGEVVREPTFKEVANVIVSPQTLVTGACYFCSFGAELAINSILGTWYRANWEKSDGFTLQRSGDWAAMFGLFNFVFRPLGGVVGDLAYNVTGTVWSKKVLLHTYGVITGAFLLAIGLLNTKKQATMFGLVAGLAFFDQGGNGINYALVPHVHPYANGIVSGFTGACGPFGGIIFALVFRYNYDHYAKSVWIIGCVTLGVNLITMWIKPLPKGQIGGR